MRNILEKRLEEFVYVVDHIVTGLEIVAYYLWQSLHDPFVIWMLIAILILFIVMVF